MHAVAALLGPDDAITGPHAAMLHGFQVQSMPDRVAVAGPSRASGRSHSPSIRRLRRTLGDGETVIVGGLRVTSPVRTIVECARLLHPREGLQVSDALLHRSAHVSRRDRAPSEARLARLQARAAQILDDEPGVLGNPHARVVLEYTDGFAESPNETEARRLALILGLPRPTLQLPVPTREGTFYPDATWEFPGSAVPPIHLKCDGVSKYVEGLDLDADRIRQAAIEELGGRFVHLSTRQIHSQGLRLIARWILPKFPAEIRQDLRPVDALRGAAHDVARRPRS